MGHPRGPLQSEGLASGALTKDSQRDQGFSSLPGDGDVQGAYAGLGCQDRQGRCPKTHKHLHRVPGLPFGRHSNGVCLIVCLIVF